MQARKHQEKGLAIMTENDAKKEKSVAYFVNGEEQESDDNTLTVAQILEKAGFIPASDYELEEEAPKEKKFKDQGHEINLKVGERFTATYIGITPTS
jgi:hypothetical protein